MHSTARLGMFSRRHFRNGAIATVFTALAAATVLPNAVASASPRTHASGGTVVASIKGPFGPMLVVGGNSQFAGTALYTITSDYGKHIGCTTAIVEVVGSKSSCTGAVGSSTAEWPALLTTGAPVAGAGVRAKLLGEVDIKGLGEEVTYNDHPLYLFDEIPGVITGENWDEPTLPPWHGNWYLLTPKGNFLPRTAILSTVTIKGKSVLAAYMEAAGGFVLFPVYSYSGGSKCTSICSDTWPPLISQGTPGVTGGVSASKVHHISRSDGTEQLTYAGKPLYFDSNEAIAPGPAGFVAVGNGNGAKAPAPFKGTFSFVKI